MEAPPLRRFRARCRGPAAPPWKETYRRRCMERLRRSRAKLLERYRQAGERACGPAPGALLVQEVMEQEWQALQAAQESRPALGGEETLAQMLEDPDELAVLEEIQQELILQEQSVLEEYERSLQFDEECLNAMLDGLDASDKVICPVCRKNHLTVRNHLVFCQCGLYISTQVSCALTNVFNGTPQVSCCEEAVLSYRQQLQCKISCNPIFSGYDRREASVTSRKHSNRAQSQMLSQPRVHSYQWNGGRNQSPHELSGL